jgi:hypothetical protein
MQQSVFSTARTGVRVGEEVVVTFVASGIVLQVPQDTPL